MCSDGRNDVSGDLALVKSCDAFGRDTFEHCCVGRIFKYMTHRSRLTIRIKIRAGCLLRKQRAVSRDLCMQPRRNGESLFGQCDRRPEQALPGQLAVTPMRQFQHAQHAGCTYCATAVHRFAKWHRLALTQE